MTLFEDAELVANGACAKTAKFAEPYVYYRVYTEDGAIPSKSPVYSDDPYLARIWAKQVALPRTVTSLKRCLSAVESISNHNGTSLFVSAKSETAMDAMSPISLTSRSFPGSTPDDPMILFAKGVDGESERLGAHRPEAALLPPQEGSTPFKLQFLYYRIYTEDGATISKQPADSSGDLSLGRIDIDTIAPPHTITSIKLRIARAEQLGKASNAKLFTNMSSESPMDATRVSILNNDRPGSVDNPMVYVYSSSVQLRVKETVAWGGCSGWLNITSGEILHMDSDCVAKPQSLNGGAYDAYTVVNSAGAVGFVHTPYVEFC